MQIHGLEIISKMETPSALYFLVRKVTDNVNNAMVMHLSDKNSWTEDVKLKSVNNKIYLVVKREQFYGLIDKINVLVYETGNSNIKIICVLDKNTSTFTIRTYETQLKKHLLFNILREGVWGSFRYFNLKQAHKSKQAEHAWVTALLLGDLSSLKWVESPFSFFE